MKKRSRAAVDSSCGTALERKYKRVMAQSKQKKPKKAIKVISSYTQAEEFNHEKFFDDVYRYYYFLDIPAASAFDAFCEVMRITNRYEAVALLYDKGIQNRDEIIDTVRKSTVKYQESIEDKFEFISNKIKDIMFKRLTK
jgi:hypothetical protein